MIFRSRHLMIYAGRGQLIDSVFAFAVLAFPRPTPKQGQRLFRVGLSAGCWHERHTPKLVWWFRSHMIPAWSEVPECFRPRGTYLAPSPIGRYGRTG